MIFSMECLKVNLQNFKFSTLFFLSYLLKVQKLVTFQYMYWNSLKKHNKCNSSRIGCLSNFIQT